MKEEIIVAHCKCIKALSQFTPIQALEILDSLRYGLIKSHKIDRPNPFPDISHLE